MARAPLNRAAIVNPASSRAMRRGKLERIALVVPGGRRGNHQPFATPFCSCILFLEALRLSIIPNRPPPPPPSFFFSSPRIVGIFSVYRLASPTIPDAINTKIFIYRRCFFLSPPSFPFVWINRAPCWFSLFEMVVQLSSGFRGRFI